MTRDLGDRERGRWQHSLHWLPALALWLAPVVAFAIIFPISLQADRSSTTAPSPKAVVVGERVRDLKLDVLAKEQLKPEQIARSGVGGVITGVMVVPGQKLATGTTLATVDGVPILAQVGGTPFYRDLARGATGEDVKQLNAWLAGRGSPVAVTAQFGRQTDSAVRQFQKSIGVTADGMFRQTYFSYVPADAAQVSTVDVQVGDQVSPGASIIGLPRTVIGTSIVAAEDAKTTSQFEGKPVALVYGSHRLEIQRANLGSADANAVAAFVQVGIDSGVLSSTVDGPLRSVKGLSLVLASPEKYGTVPGQAIFVSPSGRQCLFKTSVKGQPRPVPIAAIVSFEVGVAYVDSDLVGSRIVADPGSLPKQVRDQCR